MLLNGGVSTVSGLFVAAGQTVNQDLAFEGLDPHYVGLGLLSASTTPADYPCNAPAGGGSAAANYRPNNAPVVANAVANFSVAENSSPSQIDLAGVFSDPDITNSEVTFNTSAGPINVTLFDTTAPQTVANFFDYINAGDYNNTFFSRLIAGQYLQGGGGGLADGPDHRGGHGFDPDAHQPDRAQRVLGVERPGHARHGLAERRERQLPAELGHE